MKTITLKNNTIKEVNTRKTVFRILISALVILCLLYVYFIGSITFNILARKSLEVSRKEIGNNVSHTELKYLALSNSINAQFGRSIGFVEAQDTIFASRPEARVAIR